MFNIFQKYPNLFVVISTISDGNMRLSKDLSAKDQIFENRRIFLAKNDILDSACAGALLCHGKNVEQVFENDRGKIFKDTDGLFIKERNVFLTVTVADCLPIFLYDSKNEIVALVHAGWRGLEKNIISEAISKMKNEGSLSENILAGLGPAIGKYHFEVGDEVAQKFLRFGDEVKEKRNGKIFLDLKRIATLELIENGILKSNIEINSECTFCENEKYFSFRRDAGGDIKKLEAMIAVIGIRK